MNIIEYTDQNIAKRRLERGKVLSFLDDVKLHFFEIPWYRITHTYRRLKWAWQRAYRGYDDLAVIDAFSAISKYAHDAVSAYRKLFDSKMSYCGTPEGITIEEWKSYLDDMIYFLKWSDTDALGKYLEENPNADFDGTLVMITDFQKPLHQTDARYKKGRRLFFKHYKSLFD